MAGVLAHELSHGRKCYHDWNEPSVLTLTDTIPEPWGLTLGSTFRTHHDDPAHRA